MRTVLLLVLFFGMAIVVHADVVQPITRPAPWYYLAPPPIRFYAPRIYCNQDKDAFELPSCVPYRSLLRLPIKPSDYDDAFFVFPDSNTDTDERALDVLVRPYRAPIRPPAHPPIRPAG